MAESSTIINLKADVREERGKEWAKKARRAGKVPAVVYGATGEAKSIVVDSHEFLLVRQATGGDQVMIDLELSDGSKDKIFIKRLQRDPVNQEVIHADLLRVDANKPLQLTLKVRQIGDIPVGVKEGGMLEQIRYDVVVYGPPSSLPGHIDIDLTNLKAGESIHLSDFPKFEGVEYLVDGDPTWFTIVTKAKLAAAAAAAEAAAEQVAGDVDEPAPAPVEGELAEGEEGEEAAAEEGEEKE